MSPPRAYASLLLVEQLVAWVAFRGGAGMPTIARQIGRTERQAHAVLFGGEV